MTCLIRQTVGASRFASADPALHERVMRDVLRMAAELDPSQPPPLLTQRRIRQLTGTVDPYRELKERASEVVLAALPALAAEVQSAPDPLAAALRLASAGNTIDAGANGTGSVEGIEQELSVAYERPFHGDVDEFRRAVGSARRILFLADNAGEIVIDLLLAEHLPLERITFSVRGAPVLNEATCADAKFAGLDRLAEVIDNGSDAPGTILADCSPEFRRRFAAADLIAAKGQGNYETLSEEPRHLLPLRSSPSSATSSRGMSASRPTRRSRCARWSRTWRPRSRALPSQPEPRNDRDRALRDAERRASASSGRACGPAKHPRGGDETWQTIMNLVFRR